MSTFGERGILTQMLVVVSFRRMRLPQQAQRADERASARHHRGSWRPGRERASDERGVGPEHVLLPSRPPPDGG